MKNRNATKKVAPDQLPLAGAHRKGTRKLDGPLTYAFSQGIRKKASGGLSPGASRKNGTAAVREEPPSGDEAPEKFVTRMATVGSSWFAMVVALIYASGFLCIYTYLDHFGIRGTGGDFFRARFVYVGILFLLFPVSVIVPLVVALSLRRIYTKIRVQPRGKPPHAQRGPSRGTPTAPLQAIKAPSVHITSYLLFLNMGWVFYVCLLFTPREFLTSGGKQLVVPLIFVTSILGPAFIQWFVDHFIVAHRSDSFSRFLSWTTFIVIVAPLDYWTFKGYFHELWLILWGSGGVAPAGAITYFVLTALVPFSFWRANLRCKETTNRRGRIETRIAAACLSLMFYFLSIQSFAVRVLPYIPVAKGGGDYSEGPYAHVILRGILPVSTSILQNNMRPSQVQSGAFVVIEQTPLSLFLADAREAGGPKEWRRMKKLPRVLEIPRERIEQVVYSAF